MHCLLRGTTLTINCRSRHDVAETRGQPACTRYITGKWTNGVQTAKNDIIVLVVRNIVSLDQCLQDKTAQIRTVHGCERAASLACGASDGIDNVSFCALSHVISPFKTLS